MHDKQREQMREAEKRYEAKRKAKRQEEKKVLPTWKAVACVEAMIKEGATFELAMTVLYDVLEEKDLTISSNLRS